MDTIKILNSDRFPSLKISLHESVLLIQLNRPRELNALSTDMLGQISTCLMEADADTSISVMILTGNERTFAAGADIDELKRKTGSDVATDPRSRHWEAIRQVRKPLLGAVNGFCLGGGNELAMLCDFLVAGKNAKFGQPEVNLAILPGAGGTQRLATLVGKAKAMRWCMTGEFIDANEALTCGLVTEVCEPELTIEKTLDIAKLISTKAPLAVIEIKRAIKTAVDLPLDAGLVAERSSFSRLLDTKDKQEGISAFMEKRRPNYQGK